MPIESIRKELSKIGQLMNLWQAELWAVVWGAIAAAILWMAGLSDYFFHMSQVMRGVLWLATVSACSVGLWRIWKALTTRRTEEAVAARVEQVFPQLDNRLINIVQFAGVHTQDHLVASYLKQGVPNWREVQVKALKEWEKYKRAYIALGVATVLLAAPFAWMSESWANALIRVLNPLSPRPASTLAQIENVTPGNTSVIVGSPVVITVTAKGKARQPVSLELMPADDKAASVQLGKLAGAGNEDFSFRLPKVTANVDYRVHAGDSTSSKFRITAMTPLSVTKLDVTVTPNADSGQRERRLNGLTDQVIVPSGAKLTLTLFCNRPLARGYAALGSDAAITLTKAEGGKAMTGAVPVTAEGTVLITGYAENEEKLTASLKVQLEPDRPPVIRIVSPKGRATLAAGAVPTIQWEASDDFGLTKIAVEQLSPEAVAIAENGKASDTNKADPSAKTLQEWTLKGLRSFSQTWNGENARPSAGQSVAFRVVAYDNFNLGAGEPHRTQSAVIVFQTTSTKDISDAMAKAGSEAQQTLARLIDLQAKNLNKTKDLDAVVTTAKAERWSEVAGVQQDIRRIAGILLADPKRPLAAMQEKVMPIYQEQMQQVVGILNGIPSADEQTRSSLSGRAVAMEDWILRVLTAVEKVLPKAEKDRRISDLLGLMDTLVRNQREVLADTKIAVEKSITTNAPLAKKQDRLAGDCDQFADAATAEAANTKGSDATFADLLTKVSGEIKTRKISAIMLKAAEQLDDKAPAKAVPFEEDAVKNLEDLLAMLNAWRVGTAKAGLDDRVDELNAISSRLDKLVNMQRKVVTSMRAMKATEDKTTGRDADDKEKELKAKEENLREAMLKVATDLHIFPPTDDGNETCKEILTKYEKVEQTKGSDKAKTLDQGLQKEDFILKDMEKVAARVRDGKVTLAKEPDTTRRLTENFDQQEFKTMAMVPIGDKMEDLIGDLLKQSEEQEEKTQHSATNQATKDNVNDGELLEGEYSNYSAKGKSGNVAPKHNEQSGRSNVGRQGQSNGETAAGAGKINKGDDNIERRMTQDKAQSGDMGKVDDSEATAKATGGGKLSGTADEFGMAGAGPRRDSNSAGSDAGMQAMLRRNAQALYVKATLQHVRTGALDEVVQHMRNAEEAIKSGRPIREIREWQRLAQDALRRTQADLDGGVTVQAGEAPAEGAAKPAPEQKMAGTVDEAPEAYQGMVSDYYKAISSAPH